MTAKDAIEANVRRKIRELKREGVSGMSVFHLQQITLTVGVYCPVPDYPALFREVALKVGEAQRFSVTG